MPDHTEQDATKGTNPARDQVADDGQHGFGVDEDNHGWAPDSGGSSEPVKQANRKAWEANDTQEASRGDGDPSPDPDDPRVPSEHAGESTNRRGETMTDSEGKEAGRQDTGAKGESQRPTGTSTARDTTGVNPQEPIEP